MDRSSYMYDCIAATGFAVMSSKIVYELRPDLWSCAQDCALTFRVPKNVYGVQRMTATFEGYGDVLVLARSLDNLAQRLEWIVGRPVLSLKPAEPEAPPVERVDCFKQQEINAKESASQERVRKLATQVPPSHDCHQRREILAARKELGMSVA